MNGEAKRTRLDQRRAPIHEALENFRRMRVVPFDVPGHKRGRGNPELTAFLGQQCVGVDVNSMKPLLLTSTPTHCWPRKAVNSGLPRPRLWPGTSKGTTRICRNCSRAS